MLKHKTSSVFEFTNKLDWCIINSDVLNMAVWLSDNMSASINEVTVCRARLVLGWVTVSEVQLPLRENLSPCIINHPGQPNLAIPLWVGTMSTSDGYGYC